MDEGCAYGLTRDGCGAALGPGTGGGASVSLFLSVFFLFAFLASTILESQDLQLGVKGQLIYLCIRL